jgi:hypothetical protein
MLKPAGGLPAKPQAAAKATIGRGFVILQFAKTRYNAGRFLHPGSRRINNGRQGK